MRYLIRVILLIFGLSLLGITGGVALARQAKAQAAWLYVHTFDPYVSFLNNITRVQPDTQRRQIIADPDWDANIVTWTHHPTRLFYTVTEQYDSRLFLTTPDGSQHISLVESPRFISQQLVSPSGQWLAVSYQNRIQLVRSDGLEIQDLKQPISTIAIEGWTPDNQSLVIRASNGLFYLSIETSELIPIVRLDGDERFLTWSPDGKWLYFSLDHYPNSELHRTRRDGTGLQHLLHSEIRLGRTFHYWNLNWSPNGKWLAIQGDEDLKFEIYLIHTESGDIQSITYERGRAIFEAWLPDSDSIIYSTRCDGRTCLRRYDLSGTDNEVYRIQDQEVGKFEALSPDGEWVVVSDGYHLFGVQTNGQNAANFYTSNLTYYQNIYFHTWSPDSQWIYYGFDYELWRVHPDGTDNQKILDNVTQYLPVSWGPSIDLPLGSTQLFLFGTGSVILGLLMSLPRRSIIRHSRDHIYA